MNYKNLLAILLLAASCSTPSEHTGSASQALSGPDAPTDSLGSDAGVAGAADPTTVPTVATDKSDYAPGDTAQITGAGFAAGDTLTVQVIHINGTEEPGAGHAPFTTVADARGNYSTTWFVDPDDSFGAQFRLTVDGTNGAHAEMMFTDGGSNTQTFFITATDDGWYDTEPLHDSGNKNYIAEPSFYRDYFVFNLAGVRGTIKSATLTLPAYTATGAGVYQLFDVSTPITTLRASNSGSTAASIFNDLGSGTTYTASGVGYSSASTGTTLTITLNAAAINALISAHGGLVAFGGSVISGSGYLFGFSGGPGGIQLAVTTGIDTTAPTLSLPSAITAEATSSAGAAVPFVATATDDIDGTVAVTCIPASGSTFPLGTTTVNCSARDNSGNTATGTFSVTVRDTTPPALAQPANIVVEATGPSGTTVPIAVTATDLVDGVIAASCTPGTGMFALGTTTVNCTATDHAGNSKSTSFSVTVQDTQGPNLTVPADLTLEATSPSGAVATYAATASDLVDGVVAATCTPASGSTFALGTNTVSCSATDAHHNTTTLAFSVHVVDTTKPALTVPATIHAEATGPSGANVTYAVGATDIADAHPIISCTPASGAPFVLGTTTVQCTARDATGNTASGSFDVVVEDHTPPTLSLPATITAEATGASGAVVTYTAAAHDIVDGNVSVTCTPSSGATFALGTQTVSCAATDAHGNTAHGTFDVIVRDTTPPELVVPGPMVVEATGPLGAAVEYVTHATDLVDGQVAVTCSQSSGSTFALATTHVICTATDAHGNTTSSSFDVIVADTTPPRITVPPNLTVEATGPAGAPATFLATANDLVSGDVPVSCTPASGSTFALATTQVTCTAHDAAGNAAAALFSVTVVDTTPPQISAPAEVRVEATGSTGALAAFSVTAHDIVDGTTPVTCSKQPNTTFAIGTTLVTCSSKDAHDNTATVSFNVIVQDTTPPALTLPPDLSAEATSAAGAAVPFTATAHDIVDGDVAVTCNPPSGTVFGITTTVVSCTSTDAHGNTATGGFSVTVRDTTPPVLALPHDLAAEALGPAGAPVTFIATAHDVVDGATAVACTPAAGSTFALGITTVTCLSTDAHGNTASGAFHVTITDTTPPALHLPADLVAEATGPAGAAVIYAAAASDLVDGNVATSCAPASGTTFALGTTTVTCSATDAHGNTASGAFHVSVRDTTAPVVTTSGDQTAEATAPSGAAVTFTATAADLVSGATPTTCAPASGSTFALGATTVTCSSTDTAGNTGTASFTVTVRDTTAPTLSLPANITQVATAAAGNAVTFTATANDIVSGATPVTCTPASGSLFKPGATTVTCTSTDAAGNKATGSFTVTITFAYSGFLQPINSDNSSVFKLGSTVPVKFQLTGASAPITNLTAKLYVAKVANNVAGSDVEAVSTGNADSGNQFRYDATSNQYIFNLSTKSLSDGTWQVYADLGDGVPRTVLVSLKR